MFWKLNNFSICNKLSNICFHRNLHHHRSYDVIVVGGGHAGCEAAAAACRVGAETLLVTHKISTIGEMSCNPSFGGIGKGHLMKEIDALDGVCARICDVSGVQYRILNRSKGPAVWGPRAQIDRQLYKKHMQHEMMTTPNLSICEKPVEDLLVEDCHDNEAKYRCNGVVLANGEQVFSKSVVITTGTFLRGEIHLGMERFGAGRMDDENAIGIAKTIEGFGFKMGRLRTGTPPRVLKSTINYQGMISWHGDDPPHPFSFMNDEVYIKTDQQLPCFTTITKPEVKKLVEDSMHLNQHIREEVNGPRYCPSIESKFIRFPNKDTHTCWVEPEGWDCDEIYLQGFSCTMPREYQEKAVRLIEGFEQAEISQFGYGVEYDFIDPRQLRQTLETYLVDGLYLAGQINGTTGYEEAAAQGLIAGVNAARKSKLLDPFVVQRSDGYIGVMIDDLTTQGTNEPYRMFTSRSEFRLTLRPDNADQRLTEKGFSEGGCVGETRLLQTRQRLKLIDEVVDYLLDMIKPLYIWRNLSMEPQTRVNRDKKTALAYLGMLNIEKAHQILKLILPTSFDQITNDYWLMERVRSLALYYQVLPEQEKIINEIKKEEELVLPDYLDYSELDVKMELREKLAASRPGNLAAASRIQGITPSSLLTLLRFVKRRR